MSSSLSPRPATEIADELKELKAQIQNSVQALKDSGNPNKLLAEISSRPKFALIAFGVGGLTVALLGYLLWRKIKRPVQISKLPRKLQKQLPLLQQALNLPNSSSQQPSKSSKKLYQSAGKSIGQVIWKAAAPLIIKTVRKQLEEVTKKFH